MSWGKFGGSFLIIAAFLFLAPIPTLAQRQETTRPAPIDPAKAESEARAIVEEMLAQVPNASSTNGGQIRIRDREGNERELPARFEITITPTNWVSAYEASDPTGKSGGMRLTVTRAPGAPNRYQITTRTSPGSTNVTARELTPDQTMMPFAGSDFWVADLGLEFLHWPKQRLLKREMRHSKSCNVLESVNPHPVPGGYARVESWIIIEGPRGIVHADAYDSKGEKIKQFDPTNLEKIQGQYQLEEMEMMNRQTGSQTWIKFHLPRE